MSHTLFCEAISNSWTRIRKVGIVALMLGGLLGVVGAPSTVLAYQASCNPGRSHDNGARRVITSGVVTGINGVSSNILELDPYYSGVNGTGTNSTIMFANQPGSQWVQLGWFKSKIDGGITKRESGMQVVVGSNYFVWFGSRPVQTRTWYEILYEGSSYNFFVGGSYVATSSAFAPYSYQMFSETHDFADQMPGTSSNVETFTSSVYFTGSGHSQSHYMSGSMNSDSAYYGGQSLGSGTFYAWDTCSHPAQALAAADVSIPSALQLASSSPSTVSAATLSASDLHLFGIATAVDVTDTPNSALTASAVSRAQALTLASDELGAVSAGRVYRGTASRSPGSPIRPVWIVTTPGGTPPFDGPAGAPALPPMRLTGMIFDASTGEFWSGFMK